MKKQLATIGLAAIAVILGIVALPSAPMLSYVAFGLAGITVAAVVVSSVVKAVRS